MKNVYLRADGNPEIGLGHLIRCIALAQMIKNDFNIHFISKFAPDEIISDILSNGFKFLKIDNESDFVRLLNYRDIVIIDHYDLDTNYQKKIKSLGCKLVCIDDLHDKQFVADLIINHAPGINSSQYHAKSYTKFALGPKFALLRPEFLKVASTSYLRSHNTKLIICFGGSDINNLTCTSVELLNDNIFFEEIIVITGQSYLHRNQLRKLVKPNNRLKWYENLSASQMLTHMQNCQFALAPASSIAFELLSAGCTWLGGYYVENQKMIYQGFKELNCLVDLGNMNENFKSALSNINVSNYNTLSKVNPIDGKSGMRINDLFNALC
jgi:UDP-2,4-diacetamido-2,4,6-trideoxy-beta-L-altropyranose hydrolase